MLRTSTKNVAHEVVSCLVEPNSGILTEISRWVDIRNHSSTALISQQTRLMSKTTHGGMGALAAAAGIGAKSKDENNSLSFANAETEDEHETKFS